MAERRMFAKTIVTSDAFLDMPMSARCLYFTLGMFADDDGFVNNPKSIIRQIGASEDDMKVLLAKRFVLTFESGVIVIKHWRINNYLRSDRYHETTYTEEKALLTVDENGAYTDVGIPLVDQRYTEDSIDKDSIDNNKIPTVSRKEDYQKIIDMYHEECPSLPAVRVLTDERKKKIKARLSKHSEDEIRLAFHKAEESDFFTGRKGDWNGSFDWIMKSETNIVKILEGNYDNKDSVKQKAIRDLGSMDMSQEQYEDMERRFG